MTAPSFLWPAILDHEVAAGKPIPGTLSMAFRNCLQHLREVIMDPDIHTAAVAHDHGGDNSGHVYFPSANLLQSASLNEENVLPANANWLHRCAGQVDEYADGGGMYLGRRGEYILAEVGAGDASSEDDLASHETFGAGAPLVVSIYARRADTMTTGELRFGFCDGDPDELLPGCSASIDYTDLAPTYRRFWFRCDPGDAGTALNFVAGVSVEFDAACVIDCPAVTLGTSLGYWMPMPNDNIMWNLTKISADVPIWDSAVSITNAVRLPVVP